jgi:hypothetical protein
MSPFRNAEQNHSIKINFQNIMRLFLPQNVDSFFTSYVTVSFGGMSTLWKQLSSSYYALELTN